MHRTSCLFFALLLSHPALAQDDKPAELPRGAIARFEPQNFLSKPVYNGMYRLLFSPDGKRLVTRDLQQQIVIWSVEKKQSERMLEAHIARVGAMAISPDGQQLVAASADPNEPVAVWNLLTGEQIHKVEGGALVLRFLDGGKTWMFASETRVGKVNAKTGQVVTEQPAVRIPLAISPDGSMIAALRKLDDDKLIILDPATGQDKHVLPGLTANPTVVRFSPNGKQLAVVTRREELVRIWDIAQQKVVQTLSGHEDAVQDVAYSADGRFLATAGWDKTVRVWEAETAKQIVALEGHGDRVVSVAFSPAHRQMASGSSGRADQTALLWSVAAAVAPPHIPPAEVNDPKLAELWELLGDEDPAKGFAAAGNFIVAGEVGLGFVKAKLGGDLDPAPQEEIKRLIALLDSDDFAEREKATKELIRLRAAADTLLRQALAKAETPETKFRLSQILDAETPPSELSDNEWRRLRRLVFALETIAAGESPDADVEAASAAAKFLTDLSTGHPDVKVMRAAADAISRLDT